MSRNSGISQRYSVLNDFSGHPVQTGLFDRTDTTRAEPGISERMQLFRDEALNLSCEAVYKIRGFDRIKHRITHIITVTCTGLFAPGLDIELSRVLGLKRTVQRSSINFMGCNAAMLALRQATQICGSGPGSLVLVVCTELCTLHFQRDFTDDYITSNMLFADGSAAALIGDPLEELHGYRTMKLGHFHSLILHEGFNDMAWKLSEKGFSMNLSAYVSGLLNTNIGALLEENGIDRDDISHWAIHPGGRKILDDFCSAMLLEKEQLNTSYNVLRRYGNMSSATILFVLKDLPDERIIGKGEKIYSAAFGPGLSIESAIME